MIFDHYFLFFSLLSLSASLFVRMKKAHQQPIDRWLNFVNFPLVDADSQCVRVSNQSISVVLRFFLLLLH